jgi:alkanesulfonate monooxygenase SsuD/methylene tetrahydromethanopterin reductase-like flavin-dependent oxidoreductase (luciferase family)
MIKYGLDMASAGPAGDAYTMSELAHIAEESGWDGIFLEDYIIWQSHPDVPTYDPWIALAAMAMRTQRIRLGTMVTPIARRRPWKLAQELVTLDHLSNGRMILGVGLGDTGESIGKDSSFAHFGEMLDPKKRARMLDEGIEIITRVWNGETFSLDGKFYKINDVQILPKPIQQPRIPIWVGGGYPNRGPVERALRWDGSCMYKQQGHWMQPEDVRTLRERVIALRGTADGYDIAVGGAQRWEDEDKQRAYLESLAAEGITWWHEYIPPDGGDFEEQRKMIERGPLNIN